jgi:hypothetical protein
LLQVYQKGLDFGQSVDGFQFLVLDFGGFQLFLGAGEGESALFGEVVNLTYVVDVGLGELPVAFFMVVFSNNPEYNMCDFCI